MRLNKVIQAESDGSRIRRAGDGYLLDCPPEQVDMVRFRQRVDAGTTALKEGDIAGALAHLDTALEMWRGAPLSGVPDRSWVLLERQRLNDLHRVAVQARIEVLLASARYEVAIGELRALVQAHPTDEKPQAQLALALYRDQRSDEALEVCRLGIQTLHRNGLDPKTLRDLQNNILNQAPELMPVAPPAPHAIPRQLPPDVGGFIGRSAELGQLHGLASGSRTDESRKLVISAIAGTGGVGKTALAVHLAHQLKEEFADGQLYVNLHGYDARQSMRPEQVLDRFLRALGVVDRAIPRDLAERVALFRSMLAGRKVLLLLDNASSAEQVRALFPNTSACLVIVTSRDTLGSVVVEDGAHLLSLGVLAEREAADLLRQMIVRRLTEDDSRHISEIVGLCGGLPLAVRIAGAKIMARPTVTLQAFVDYLRDERYRLEALNAGDVSVRACFSLSYNSLLAEERHVFRLLGLIAGPDFSADGAAALVGRPAYEVRRIIDGLVNAHLLETSPDGDRFRFHDLLRLYSRERVESEETEQNQRRAVERLLRWYRSVADFASDNVMQIQRMPRERSTPDPPIDVSTRLVSMQWLEAERACLVAATDQAYDYGLTRLTWELADSQWGFFYLRKRWAEWESSIETALRAAREAGDPEALSWMLTNLGVCYWDQHQPRQAIECFQAALDIASEHGYQTCEARDLNGLALAYRDMQRWDEALKYVQIALPKRRAAGDAWGEAVSLDNTALILGKLGRTAESIDTFEQALALWADIGDPWGHALTLTDMARTLTEAGSFSSAIPHFREAIEIRRVVGDLWGEAESLYYLGMALREVEGVDAARRCWLNALKIMSDLHAQEAGEIRRLLEELG